MPIMTNLYIIYCFFCIAARRPPRWRRPRSDCPPRAALECARYSREREGEKNPLPPEPEQDPDDPENQKEVMEIIMGKKAGAELPEYAQRAKRNSQLSYIGRVALMAILLLAAALLPCFNVLAALVPLLLQRFVLMILSASNKDEQKEAPGHGQ